MSSYSSALAAGSPAPFHYWPLDQSFSGGGGYATNLGSNTGTSFFIAEGSGNNCEVSSQNSLIGTYPSSGYSIKMNGTNNYLTVDANWSAGTVHSLECWFRTTSSGGSSSTWYANPGILHFGTSSYSSNRVYGFGLKSGNFICGARLTSIEGGMVNDGLPHHAVIARNGDSVECILDGVSLGTITGMSTTNTTVQRLTIGRNAISTFYYFNGWIDEIALYDVALSASDALSHYNLAEPYGPDPASEETGSILDTPSTGFIPVFSI